MSASRRSRVQRVESEQFGQTMTAASRETAIEPPMHEAFMARARETLSYAPPLEDATAYRIVWTTGSVMNWYDLSAEPGSFCVLGRHRACGAVLCDDPSIALRHLLIALSDGAAERGTRPSLRVMDLRTERPFTVGDDPLERRGMETGEPFSLRIGAHRIGALPIAHADRPVTEPVVSSMAAMREGSPLAHGITMVSEVGRASGPVVGTLTLRRGAHCETVLLRALDLECGVMIGRYERCLDHGLRSLLTERISRCHLLLQRWGRSVRVVDLASTNGVTHDGVRIGAARIPSEGITLQLADEITLVWRFLSGIVYPSTIA